MSKICDKKWIFLPNYGLDRHKETQLGGKGCRDQETYLITLHRKTVFPERHGYFEGRDSAVHVF